MRPSALKELSMNPQQQQPKPQLKIKLSTQPSVRALTPCLSYVM